MKGVYGRWYRRMQLGDQSYLLKTHTLTNNEEKVKHMLQYLLDNERPLDIQRLSKSTEKAIGYIEQGNLEFHSKSWKHLIEIYTQAVAHAQPDSNELARAYGNRSAALFSGGLYEDSLTDIERALKIGYAENTKAKLYARRARCLFVLHKKMLPEVKEAMADARKWLEKMDDVNKKYIIGILDNVCKTSLLAAPFKKYDSRKFLPQSPDDSMKLGVSSAVEFKYSTKFGRHIVVTRDIKAGETLYVRRAYASIIYPHLCHKYCWNCSKRAWAGVPCHQCIGVIYCNETCRDQAWNEHHDIECPVITAIFGGQMGEIEIMALRLTVKAYKEAGTFEKLKEKIGKVDAVQDPIAKCFSDDVFDTTKYESIYSLSSDIPKPFIRELKSALVLYFLAATTEIFGEKIDNFRNLLDHKWTIFIGGLIMRHLGIGSMCRTTMSVNDDNDRMIDRGTVIDGFTSLCNHNCDPTVSHHNYWGDITVIVALQKIKKGEQIFLSYRSKFWEEPPTTRKTYLHKFNFECDCKPCLQEWEPASVGFFPSYPRANWPPSIQKRLKLINRKYPSSDLWKGSNIADKPLILSTLLDMINVYQENIEYPTIEMIAYKMLLVGLYNSITG